MSKKEEINAILLECAKNNRIAQEKLFKLFYGKMLYVCLRYTNDRDTAQEIVQEGFIKVFEKIGSFDLLGSFDAWIKRVMINTSIDYIRKNKKHAFTELNDNHNDSFNDEDADFELDYEIQREMALESIQELSPGYRMVFNLYFVEDYSHKEIAEKLGISEGTSKSNLAKAKQRLKQIVEAKMERKD
ncbi:MAG: sigma-70 family RNA polymerase sigma factor [Bacteroidota bacterium]